MRRWLAALALLFLSRPAFAGAWTEPADHWQVIAALWASSAARAYDGHGAPAHRTGFHKLLFQTNTEYGWNDRLTLFLDSETAYAAVRDGAVPEQRGLDNAVEAGARYRLTDTFGVLSFQVSAKTAGAFNFSVSANSTAAGRQAELRLLFGTNFALCGDAGFLDFEAGERFISAPRPGETPVDLTAGLWLSPRWMAMLQSFNIISGGDGTPPYASYRSHKLALSVVRKLSDRLLVQAGGFLSPLGRNALVEEGVNLALWARF